MRLENPLDRISTTKSLNLANEAAEVKSFLEELAPAIDQARGHIQDLKQLRGEEIAPLLKKYEGRIFQDRQLNLWIEELQNFRKPEELELVIEDIKKVTFKSLTTPPYTDRIDQRKRQVFISEYRGRLTAIGIVREDVRRIIAAIEGRIKYLAERAGGEVVGLTAPVVKAKPELSVLSDLDPD
ncbi:MAG TPA: hypothetical protein VEQ38_25580 [Verrucomicrobiae bacterium]|nr:hypothetical protein [Verrucomicrobiae bacterium]